MTNLVPGTSLRVLAVFQQKAMRTVLSLLLVFHGSRKVITQHSPLGSWGQGEMGYGTGQGGGYAGMNGPAPQELG